MGELVGMHAPRRSMGLFALLLGTGMALNALGDARSEQGGNSLAAHSRARRTLAIELPDMAASPVRLEERTSGVAVSFGLENLGAVPAARSPGGAVYRNAPGSGRDLTLVLGDERFEDFVSFPEKPERAAVTYRLDLSRVAGLRLVASVLELLDAKGTPRLRMLAPYVVDAHGTRHELAIQIRGCAFDTNPVGPWGRPVTPPGAALCKLDLDWSDRDVAYPAVLDPV